MAAPRSITRKLQRTAKKIARLRDDLEISRQQLLQLNDDADDAELRAIVGEGGDLRAGRDADRHRHRLAAHCEKVQAELAELEQHQNDLLDAMSSSRAD